MRRQRLKGYRNAYELIPETAIEAVESLEEFFIADWGAKDWGPKFFKAHFAITKKQIRAIERKRRENIKD